MAAEAAQTAEAVEGFRAVHGGDPAGVWAAPGRVNLIGEHTDYNDGFVMPLALPHTARVAADRRDDGALNLYSADVPDGTARLTVDKLAAEREAGLASGGGGGFGGWAAYPAGVVWAMREEGLLPGDGAGADLYVRSDVPVGAGLSSSAALEVATAVALNDLYGLGLSPERIALLCRRAENDFVGVPSGIMDQMASACCTAGHALYLDTRDLTRRQVPLDLAAEGLRLLVVDTRVQHALGDGEYARRRAGCEEAAAALGVRALRDVPYEELDAVPARLADPALLPLVRHVVTENRRVRRVIDLLDAGETRAVGPVLTEGHASLRDDFAVSCPELDLVVETANAAGALGARMTGGGFGGSAIVLVEAAGAESVGAAVTEAFAAAGHRPPRLFEALPSTGARRLDV
ncbi:galactokinase [Streptomyces sp. TRM43335]|uniref:Galactokinase n=1 Tax=Streptomyces taklimakanensis TaxID=2569853 RepID=A0A6G2BAV1_9ACTN|nr:galactokinase [Streptomyces taklimakanensis]MTE19405.1 galactokinase [Streptomyces taklimakanensis]